MANDLLLLDDGTSYLLLDDATSRLIVGVSADVQDLGGGVKYETDDPLHYIAGGERLHYEAAGALHYLGKD